MHNIIYVSTESPCYLSQAFTVVAGNNRFAVCDEHYEKGRNLYRQDTNPTTPVQAHLSNMHDRTRDTRIHDITCLLHPLPRSAIEVCRSASHSTAAQASPGIGTFPHRSLKWPPPPAAILAEYGL